jgi:hypothetical protein
MTEYAIWAGTQWGSNKETNIEGTFNESKLVQGAVTPEEVKVTVNPENFLKDEVARAR